MQITNSVVCGRSKGCIYKQTRIDIYETLCPQQMLVHKGGKIKNWVGSARMPHLQNCSLTIYLKRALGGGRVRGGGGGGGGGQDG